MSTFEKLEQYMTYNILKFIFEILCLDPAVRVKLRKEIPQIIFSTFSSPQNITFTCFSTNSSQFSPTRVHNCNNSSHMRAVQFKKFSSVQ